MAGILGLLMSGAGLIKDQYFNLTTLLLPGNGTNGAQNNTFLDSSTNNFTITRNGNTTQGTFSPFSQTGWGNLFVSASSQYLSLSSSSFAVGTGAFTIEGWVYLNSYTYGSVFSTWNSVNTGVGMMLGFDNTGKIQFSIGNASGSADTTIVTASSISLNTWVFLQATKSAGSGGAMTIYINGTSSATTTTTRSVDRSAAVIGRYYQDAAGNQINGYLSNVRVSNTVRSSTVPTAPFTNDANTLLLTCQSNRFLDVSSTPITITPNGSPTVVAFSPFAPTAAYTTAAVGGSGYFDSNGDFLSGIGTTSSFNFMHNTTALFTIEAWVYKTVAGSQMQIAVNNDSASANIGISFYITTANQLSLFISRGVGGAVVIDTTSTGTVPINTWTHVAVTYDQSLASSNATFYINGSSAGTGNKTANTPSSSNATNALCIGARTTGADPFSGYMNGVRISNIVRSISVPTSPYTSDGNTSLLLNFTNGGAVDATAKNVLETVGNAQISTSVSKFGGGSIAFDGTGDYLSMLATPILALGTGPYTIEAWINLSALPTAGNTAPIYQNGTHQSGTVFHELVVFNDSSTYKLQGNLYNGSSYVYQPTATFTPSTGVWYHVAFIYTGTVAYVAVNGVLSTGVTASGTCPNSTVFVGYQPYTAGGQFFLNGYIDDLRITRYARYTSNFTPPTAPFPRQ